MKYVIGIDIGTTGTKAMLIDMKGHIIGTSYKGYNLINENGCILQDPECWKQAVCYTIQNVSENINVNNVTALSLSSQGGTLVYGDEKGQPICDAYSWMDENTLEQYNELNVRGIDFKGITGWSLDKGLPLLKIIKYGTNGAKLIMATDSYIINFLTGRFITDPSDAAMTQMYSVSEQRWDESILDLTEINNKMLPEVVDSGKYIANLTSDAAALTGLTEKVKVYSGAHDQYCVAYGAGISSDGDTLIATGTAWAIMNISSQIKTDGESFGRHITSGMYGKLSTISVAGAAMEWLKNKTAHENFRTIDSQADKINTAPLYIPQFTDSKMNQIQKLLDNSDPYTTARAIMEGISMQTRYLIENEQSHRIIVTGGATKSTVWMQILANVLNKDIITISEPDIACAGACLIALKAEGFCDNIIWDTKLYKSIGGYDCKYCEYKKEAQNGKST